MPAAEGAALVTEPRAAEVVLTSVAAGPVAASRAPGWEAAGAPPGAAEEVMAETAELTADAAEVVPEVSGEAELVDAGTWLADTDAGISGDEATVAARACRESSRKRTQMAPATSTIRTARRAMRRALSCGTGSSCVPEAGPDPFSIFSELEARMPANFHAGVHQQADSPAVSRVRPPPYSSLSNARKHR